MTEPGWYHGEGDPAGTVRYWTGQAWAGGPTTNPGGRGEVYYAAPAESSYSTTMPGVAGAVSYVQQPTAAHEPMVQQHYVEAIPARRIPDGARLTAIAISVLKAGPLVLMLLNTILIAIFGTVGLELAYNEDLEQLLSLTILVSLATIALGFLLILFQALGAAKNSALMLFLPALIMTVLDAIFTLGAWANDHSTDQFFYTGLFIAQAWVFIGSIIGLVKRTP